MFIISQFNKGTGCLVGSGSSVMNLNQKSVIPEFPDYIIDYLDVG
jgi:hypothetical protein